MTRGRARAAVALATLTLALAVVVVAVAAPGCKRKPRTGKTAAPARHGSVDDQLSRKRSRVLIRVRFDDPAAAAVVGFLPTPFATILNGCKVDIGTELGRFEVEVAGPLMFRIELSGPLPKEKAECTMAAVLPPGTRAGVAPRAGGGLVITTPQMLLGDEATRTRLEARAADAPAEMPFVMVVLSGPRASTETLVVGGVLTTELRIRYLDEVVAKAAGERLRKNMNEWGFTETPPMVVKGRELTLGPTLLLQLAEVAQKTTIVSVDVMQDDLGPDLQRGDSVFAVRGPYFDPASVGVGDVVTFACVDDPMKWCLSKVGVAGDGGVALPVPRDKLLGRVALVWWSVAISGVRWDRVWKLVD